MPYYPPVMYKILTVIKNNTLIYDKFKIFLQIKILFVKIVYMYSWHVNCIKESERFREGGVFCEALRRFNNWRWYYWLLDAYYTSKYGRDVTIIEKGEFVSGTSSRCDGNILAIDKDRGLIVKCR